jgi:hypothetical protein
MKLGELVSISVGVENQRTGNENFSVTVSYDSTIIEKQNFTDLDSGTNMTLNFVWDTPNITFGTYSINATASFVPDKTYTTNNLLTSPSKVYILRVFGVEGTLFYLIAYQTIPRVYLNIYHLGIFFSPRMEIVLFGNFIAFAFLFTAGMFKRRKTV